MKLTFGTQNIYMLLSYSVAYGKNPVFFGWQSLFVAI